jgi:anti-anti-sigma regulatory factor
MADYTVEERGDDAVVAFPEFADARRTVEDERILRSLVLSKRRVVFDLTRCQIVDTPWLRLMTVLSKEADNAGRFVAIAGASDETKNSTDYLGQRKYLHLYDGVEDALKS